MSDQKPRTKKAPAPAGDGTWVVYTGRHRLVEIPSLGIVAHQGKPVQVPDEAAESLLEQKSNWKKSKAPAKAAEDKE